jgi:glucokinase
MKQAAGLGIDIGGTKTLCLLVNEGRQIIESCKFKTAPHEGCKEFTQKLLEVLKTLNKTAQGNRYHLVGIGVGCAGSVDAKKRIINKSPNLLCLEGFRIGKWLKKNFGTEVTLGNDVQMGMAAEHNLGAAHGCEHVLGVFFGTGVGGAAIINGELYRGASGVGGQVGSILAQPVGGPEAASSHGILDRIASKAAIASEALVMAIKEWSPYLHKKVGTDLSKVTWGILKRAIAHGDQRIDEMLRARLRVVGIALSSVVNFLNPEMVLLGGGLTNEMPRLVVSEVERGLREYLIPEVGKALRVKKTALGGDGVALGAADAALDRG